MAAIKGGSKLSARLANLGINTGATSLLQNVATGVAADVADRAADMRVVVDNIVKADPTLLDFTSFEFSETSLQELVRVITDPMTTHVSLILSGCFLGDWFGEYIASAVVASNLLTLDLSHCYLGVKGATALASALPNTKIINLNTWANGFGNAGMKILAAALPSCQLNTLSLRSNRIGDVGVKALAKALPQTGISWLSLQNNPIRYQGARYLSTVLMNTRVKVLRLEGTALDSDSFKILMGIRFESVAEGKQFGQKGASSWLYQAVREILPVFHITTLDLSFNHFGPSAVDVFRENLDKTNLTYLNLTNCGLDNDTCSSLMSAFSIGVQPNELSTLVIEGNAMSAVEPIMQHISDEKCNLTSLNIARNQIDTDGVSKLIAFLPKRFDDEDEDTLKTSQEYVKWVGGMKKSERTVHDYYSMRRSCKLRTLLIDSGSQMGYGQPGPNPAVLEKDGLQMQINMLIKGILAEGTRK